MSVSPPSSPPVSPTMVVDVNLLEGAGTLDMDSNGRGSTTKHPFKYVCPFCTKRYTSRSGLLSHKNTIHFQRKPYRCQYCNSHFFTSAQRVAHIHRAHPGGSQEALSTGTGERRGPAPKTQRQKRQLKQQKQKEQLQPTPTKAPIRLAPQGMPASSMAATTDRPANPVLLRSVGGPGQLMRIAAAAPKTTTLTISKGNIVTTNTADDATPANPTASAPAARASQSTPADSGQNDQPPEDDLVTAGLPPVRHDHPWPQLTRRSVQIGRDLFTCLECGGGGRHFDREEPFLQHLEHAHGSAADADGDEGLRRCALCVDENGHENNDDDDDNRPTMTETELADHLVRHHIQGISTSPNKKKPSTSSSSSTLQCLPCQRTFPNSQWHGIHLKYHHPDQYTERVMSQQPQHCPRCQRTFADLEAKEAHQMLYCQVSLPCLSCHLRFDSLSELLSHARREHPNRPKKSLEASVTPAQRSSAIRELKRGKDLSKLNCPVCQTGFKWQDDYVRHMEVVHNSQVEKVACAFCEFVAVGSAEAEENGVGGVGSGVDEMYKHMRQEHADQCEDMDIAVVEVEQKTEITTSE